MKSGFSTLCAFALVSLASLRLPAQSSSGPGAQAPTPARTQQQSSAAPSSGPATNQNPFPEDSNSVPVMTPNGSAAPPPAVDDSTAAMLLPREDSDPVRSPEGAASSDGNFSSSSAGMDELLPDPDSGKLRKGEKPPEPEHHADAQEDESVGSYYLGLKNWHAALSRFESALVTDPENPDVYWGMAEAQRNLKQFASARANYLKVIAYDPDSKHARDAHRILRQPEFAVTPGSTAQSTPPAK